MRVQASYMVIYIHVHIMFIEKTKPKRVLTDNTFKIQLCHRLLLNKVIYFSHQLKWVFAVNNLQIFFGNYFQVHHSRSSNHSMGWIHMTLYYHSDLWWPKIWNTQENIGKLRKTERASWKGSLCQATTGVGLEADFRSFGPWNRENIVYIT